MWLPILAALLVFTAVMFLILGIASPTSNKDMVSERMDAIASTDDRPGDVPSIVERELGDSFLTRIVKPTLQRCGEIALRLSPGGATDTVRANLVRAGNPLGMDVVEFNGIRLASIAFFFLVGLFGQYVAGDDPIYKLGAFGLSVLIGFVLPDSMLQQAITARQTLIRRALPNTIDLLVVSVEAGMGFDGAVQKVVEKVRGPLSDEFGRALHEMKLGKTRAKALKDMAARIGIPEINSFVAAIYQSELLGVSIANVLRIQSDSIRIAHIQRIKELAAKLPVKMLFPLVFFIFPAIFLVLLGPGLISIANAFKNM